MKTIKFLLVALFLTANTLMVTAGTTNPSEGALVLINKQVQKLLKNPKFELKTDVSVIVKLTINSKNELIVLSVDSKNNTEKIENYIKRSLNYKKIQGKVNTEVYNLPVTLVASK
ncbi:hypothetical protein [Tenacibaculum piscium]|uniref:Uncharacterized protein n=1 Tax=Tenacibaculum piscium TaxID=1458515 RepID=A0A2H1YG01_9FLAO|nr:hypothetical protein [Tenacibaculum piscium]MBE7629670.1 hypothetical protein [Tenacibaculum piscium]MBE7670615.1 hypothetical protein [Tenacibaculum piscium]MBE7685310.1 hypothetical protein [Tenacibaculum piscium]MBE7690586.1 hypothetical protein [Tenacibaculum piscium]MCG8182503.1 hypothetical protein [Tenacibaculum piscium]